MGTISSIKVAMDELYTILLRNTDTPKADHLDYCLEEEAGLA